MRDAARPAAPDRHVQRRCCSRARSSAVAPSRCRRRRRTSTRAIAFIDQRGRRRRHRALARARSARWRCRGRAARVAQLRGRHRRLHRRGAGDASTSPRPPRRRQRVRVRHRLGGEPPPDRGRRARPARASRSSCSTTDAGRRGGGEVPRYVESPVLTDVKRRARRLRRLRRRAARVMPDVFAERPVIVFGKWRGAPKGSVTLTGVTGKGRFVSTARRRARRSPTPSNAALRTCGRARASRELSDFYDEDDERTRPRSPRSACSYNLLTHYTSFIAVAAGRAQPTARVDRRRPAAAAAGGRQRQRGRAWSGAPSPACSILLALVGLVLLALPAPRPRGAAA